MHWCFLCLLGILCVSIVAESPDGNLLQGGESSASWGDGPHVAPSACHNVTAAIQTRISTLLREVSASAPSAADLDSFELALSASASAESHLLRTGTNLSYALQQAAAGYRMVVDEAPDVPSAYCRLAELLLAANETVQGLETLEELLLRWPDNPVGLRLSAAALYARGQYALAAAKGERLVTIRVSTQQDLLQLGRALFRMARSQSVGSRDGHGEHRGQDPPNGVAASQAESQLLEKAEQYFSAALSRPEDGGTSFSDDKLSMADDPRSLQDAKLSSSEDIAVHMDFALVLAARQKWERANSVVDEFMSRFPNTARVHFTKAKMCLEQAAFMSSAGGSRSNSNAVAYLEAQAVSHFQQATWLDAQMWEAHWELGRLLATKPHRVDEAMVHLHQVVRLRPDFSDGFLTSAKILAAQGNIAEALRMYRRGSAASTADASVTADFAQILLAEKGLPSKLAVHQYEQMIQELPEEPSIHILLARTLTEMGSLADEPSPEIWLARSEARFRVALRLSPNSFEAHYGIARCLERQGADRFAEAEVHYNRAIELDESHVELRLDVVRLKLVEYETLPEPAPVVLNPMAFSSKETADTLRAVPRKLRLNEEIVSHLRAAIRVQPHAAQLHHMLGDAVVNGSSLRNQRDRYMDSSAEALHLTLRQCDVVSVSMNGDRERCDCAHYDDCNSILRHLGPEVAMAASTGRRHYHKAVGLNKTSVEAMFSFALALEGEALNVVENAIESAAHGDNDAVASVVLTNKSYEAVRKFQRQAALAYETALNLHKSRRTAQDVADEEVSSPSSRQGGSRPQNTHQASQQRVWRHLLFHWRLCRLYVKLGHGSKATECFFDATERAQGVIGRGSPSGNGRSEEPPRAEGATPAPFDAKPPPFEYRERGRKFQRNQPLPSFVFGHVPPRPGNESREHANESMRTPANKFVQLETCGGQSRCQWALLWSELAAAHFSLGDPQSARHVLSAALVEWPQCVALHREMATVLLSLGSDMQSERDQVLQHVEWTLHQQMQQVRRKNDTGLSASHSTTGRQDLSNFDLLSPWPGPSPDPPSVTAGGASATKHLLPVHAVLSSVCGPETIGSRGVQSVPASVVDLLIAAGGDTDVAILAVVLGVQRGLAALSATTPPNSKEQWTPVGEPREPLTMETGILHDTIIADRVIHDELQRAPESAATIIREVTNGPRQLRPRPPSTLSTPTPESSRNQSLRHFTKEWIEYVVSHSYDDICVWLSDGLCSRAENAAGAPSSELWESPSFWTTGLPSRCVGNSSFVGVLNEPLLQIAELARLRGHWLASANCFSRVSDDSLSVSFAQLRLANIRERHFSDGLFSEMGLVNSSRNPFQARFARSHVAFLQKSSTVISPFLQQVLSMSELSALGDTKDSGHAHRESYTDQQSEQTALVQCYSLALLHLHLSSHSSVAPSSPDSASSDFTKRCHCAGMQSSCNGICFPVFRTVAFHQLPLLLEAADFFEVHAVDCLLGKCDSSYVDDDSGGNSAGSDDDDDFNNHPPSDHTEILLPPMVTRRVAGLLENETFLSLADFAGADLDLAMRSKNTEGEQTADFWAAATNLYLDAASKYPSSVEAQLEAIEALMRRGKWSMAMASLQRLVAELPDPEKDAHRQYNVLKFQPVYQQQYLPQHLLAVCMFQATAGLLEAQRSIRETGGESSLASQRHWAAQLKQVAKNTTSQFQQALSIADGMRDARALAAIFNDLGQFHELMADAQLAANNYVRAIDAASLTPVLWTPALTHLGRLLLHDNQPTTAQSFFERSVHRFASSAQSPHLGDDTSLSTASSRDVDILSEAELRWVNPLVAKQYVDGLRVASQSGLAQTLLIEGRYSQALQVLQDALSQHPFNVDLLELSTTCLRALGRAEDARAQLQLAIQLREQRLDAFVAERRRSAAAVADINRVAWSFDDDEATTDSYIAHYKQQQLEERRRWSPGSKVAQLGSNVTQADKMAWHNGPCRATLFQGAHFDGWEATFVGTGSFSSTVLAEGGAKVDEVSSLRVEGGDRSSLCIVELFEGDNCDGRWTASFGPGSFPLSDLAAAGVVNDRTRSIRISVHSSNSNESSNQDVVHFDAQTNVPLTSSERLSAHLQRSDSLCSGLQLGVSGRACQTYVKYRQKTHQLRELEQAVIREAVVASEIQLFLDEAAAFDRSGRVSDTIHRAKIAVELATARMPSKAGFALLRLCIFEGRAGLSDMAAASCRRAIHAKPASCSAQLQLAKLEAQARKYSGAVKLLDDLLHGVHKEWGETVNEIAQLKDEATRLLPKYLELAGDPGAAAAHFVQWIRKEPRCSTALLSLGKLLATSAASATTVVPAATNVSAGSKLSMLWTGQDNAFAALGILSQLTWNILESHAAALGDAWSQRNWDKDDAGLGFSPNGISAPTFDLHQFSRGSDGFLSTTHARRFLELLHVALLTNETQMLSTTERQWMASAAASVGHLWLRVAQISQSTTDFDMVMETDIDAWNAVAAESFETAALFDPYNVQSGVGLAKVRLTEGDIDGAIAVFRRIIANAEMTRRAVGVPDWILFGTCLATKGLEADARLAFERALSSADEAHAGNVSTDTHRSFERRARADRSAAGSNNDAVTLSLPHSSNARYTVADVHALFAQALTRLQDWSEAEAHFHSAERAGHRLTYAALHDFGMCELHLGKKEEGLPLLRRAVNVSLSMSSANVSGVAEYVVDGTVGRFSAAIRLCEVLAADDNTLTVASAGTIVADNSRETRQVLGQVLQRLKDSHGLEQRWRETALKAADRGPALAALAGSRGCGRVRDVLDRARDWSAATRLLARDYLRRPKRSSDADAAVDIIVTATAVVNDAVQFAEQAGLAAAGASTTANQGAATQFPWTGIAERCPSQQFEGLRERLTHLHAQLTVLRNDAMQILRERSGLLSNSAQRLLVDVIEAQ